MKLITRATSAMTAMAAAWKGFNPAGSPLPGEKATAWPATLPWSGCTGRCGLTRSAGP
ncbi:hypothetical protein LP416_27930 [Polaromonas sp. P2-4]|nr:hypothetical protein LP416_27930 [Polaromonas sp. P2-4]